MGFVLLGIFAFFGYFGWWWLVPVLALGFLWDASSVTGRARNALLRRRQSQTPRQWELGNAGRGAGLLALGGWWIGWRPMAEFLSAAWPSPDVEHGGAVLAVGGVAGVGLLAFFSGAHRALRAAGERDARLIGWAAFRLGLGAALWWVFDHPPPGWAAWAALARALPYSAIAVTVLALWLAVTGGTKLLLILWEQNDATAIIRRILQGRNAPLVAARRRRF